MDRDENFVTGDLLFQCGFFSQYLLDQELNAPTAEIVPVLSPAFDTAPVKPVMNGFVTGRATAERRRHPVQVISG